MTEKFSEEFHENPAWYAAEKQREDDLRIKMFALDMAVTALPSLASSIDSEDTKFFTLRRAAAEFEAYLKGEPKPIRSSVS